MNVNFEENFDIENFNDNIKTNEINQRIEITERIINFIKTLFEDFQSSSEELLDTILNQFAEKKSEELKNLNNEYYDKMNTLYKKITRKDMNYYYFLYHLLNYIFSF